jgi:hypothetical protein
MRAGDPGGIQTQADIWEPVRPIFFSFGAANNINRSDYSRSTAAGMKKRSCTKLGGRRDHDLVASTRAGRDETVAIILALRTTGDPARGRDWIQAQRVRQADGGRGRRLPCHLRRRLVGLIGTTSGYRCHPPWATHIFWARRRASQQMTEARGAERSSKPTPTRCRHEVQRNGPQKQHGAASNVDTAASTAMRFASRFGSRGRPPWTLGAAGSGGFFGPSLAPPSTARPSRVN